MSTQIVPPHPNRLRTLAHEAGYNIRALSKVSEIPEGTLRRWVDGQNIIPHAQRIKLAEIIGCDVKDLAPGSSPVGYDMQESREGKIIIGTLYGRELEILRMQSLDNLASPHALALMQQADVDCFAVDDLMVLTQSADWRGWDPDDIKITTLASSLPVPADIEELRQAKLPRIQQNYVNSAHFKLAAFTPMFSDRRFLEITLAPIGFHDFYSLMPFLDEPLLEGGVSIRAKYGDTAFTYGSPQDCCKIPAPVSLQGVLVTKDNQIILMQRSNSVAFYPLHWSASFEETMDAPGMTPKKVIRPGDADFFDCARRGLEEEFGVPAEAITSIKVLSLNVEYLILAIGALTVIHVDLTAQEVKTHWMLQAPDKNEASKLATISTELSAVIEKLRSEMLWHPTSRMRLLQFLFHTYGVKDVAQALMQP